MRQIKWLALFIALAVILMTATIAFADDPFGGPPGGGSGIGTTTWGAIYIGDQCSPSVKFPAHTALWFKADAWSDYKLQVWLDDDPQWGAANKYFENNPDPSTSDQSSNLINGFWLRVYSPDSLNINYWYPEQGSRMDLLTTNNGIRADGTEIPWVGMANNNKFVTNHLLWYEARFNGWVYIRVENKMSWDNNAIVCTHREYSPKPQPPAPPSPPSDDSNSNTSNNPCDAPDCHLHPGQDRH